jgi:glycosyl transferase family 25
VLDDDLIVREGLPAVLDGLVAQPGRWDVAKLSRVHSGTPVPVGEVAAGHRLAVMLTRCTGSSAYVVNRRAAGAYLRGLLPMALPYDHVFDQGWRFGLKVRLVVPAPCTHDEAAASTILGPEGSRKFHWTRRLPAYAYRWRTESRRFVRGLSEVVREVTA